MDAEVLWEKYEESKNIQMLSFSVLFTITFYLTLILLRKFWGHFKELEVTVQNQIVSRVVSSLHAVLVTLMGIYVLIWDTGLSKNKLLYTSFRTSLTLNVVIGYLFFDFWAMVIYKEIFDWQFVLHHFVSVSAFYFCSHVGVFPYIAMLRLLSEASTVFINLRWLLLTLKMKGSKLYHYNGYFILVVFGLFRIVTIIPIWYTFYENTQSLGWSSMHIGYKLLCIGTSLPLDVLNIYWFYKIVFIIWKYFSVSKKPTKTQ